MTDDTLSLARTKEALANYDRLRALLLEATGTSEFNAAYDRLVQAESAVKAAFADDTADRNPRESAMLISPESEWLRRMVAKYGGQ
jgi:hypothetical protein